MQAILLNLLRNARRLMMKNEQIDNLRHSVRKVIRELGLMELDAENSQKTPAHWHALIEVSKKPGITISELGHLLLISTSSISRLVKSLVKNEILTLGEGHDKREKSLFLTDKGQVEIHKINTFSDAKIRGAFEFLTDAEKESIIQSMIKYGEALEKSRVIREDIKILTLSTSRIIRNQIVNMISNIQKNEFSLQITKELNGCVLQAEKEYYFNNSYNFWYATNKEGKLLGCIGLKSINNQWGQIRKFFVCKEYRGKGVAQKLMNTLLKAAEKHKINNLILGTVHKFHAAQRFYEKYGFQLMDPIEFPEGFQPTPFDGLFYKRKTA
jgi:DNA-binding MarR family transcriptional regulator/N-acetylglutamate synthase-like GNAT family acetyltransferase